MRNEGWGKMAKTRKSGCRVGLDCTGPHCINMALLLINVDIEAVNNLHCECTRHPLPNTIKINPGI
jgi:hypothetical protein